MMWRSVATAILTGLLATPAWSASSALSRVWVSSHGSDQAGCGAVSAPCRSMQFAHDTVSAGGEIDVLDPSGYGSVIITKAINIINDGAGTAGLLAQPGGNAVTITAGAGDAVNLRGLTIEGAGAGLNGIVLNAAGSLTVTDCTLRGFTGNTNASGNGMFLYVSTANPNIVIRDTTISDTQSAGINSLFKGSGRETLTVDHLSVNDAQYGMVVFGANTAFSIRNSTLSGTTTDGLLLETSTLSVIDATAIIDNLGGGLVTRSNQPTLLGRSVIANNAGIGVTVTNNAVLYSYGDNSINGNLNADTSGVLTVIPRQ